MMPENSLRFGRALWLLPIFTVIWPAFLFSILPDWEQKARVAFDNGQFDEARQLAESALTIPATACAAHQLLGRIALAKRRSEEAISHFQAASAKGRLSQEVERDWATALLNLGKYREACELMENFLSRDPSQVDLRYRLAGSYLALGRYREAWPHLEEAYRQGLRHAGVLLQLARTRFFVGQDDRAVELLESVSQESTSPDVLWEIGKLLFERLLYPQALSPLRKAWEQKPGSYEVGMYLALSHYLIKQYSESEHVLTAIQPGPNPPLDYRILLGSVYARLGRWQQAQQELEKAIRQSPNRADGYLNLGLFYLERGDQQLSMEMLEKGSGMMVKGTKLLYSMHDRDSCDGLAPPTVIRNRDSLKGEFYSKLARTLQHTEQRSSALEIYRLALSVDNSAAPAYAGIGHICWELDSPVVARSFLQKGLELHPNNADLHFSLGLLLQSLGQIDESIRHYQKAIELQEPNAPALHWTQLGTAQLAGAKENEIAAEASFRRALERDPGFAQAHYELGKLYFQRREFDQAEQSFENAVRYDPQLLRAYYQYGLTCIRNGKSEKGRMLLNTFNRKRALHASNEQGMSLGSPVSSPVFP
ncbi:MAG: hypothetical protein DMG06_09950 [Acidobacteria bacterium]|nr:MAG: hypothetical protein DMG06_09950 [Acidobacteriota bacterium]